MRISLFAVALVVALPASAQMFTTRDSGPQCELIDPQVGVKQTWAPAANGLCDARQAPLYGGTGIVSLITPPQAPAIGDCLRVEALGVLRNTGQCVAPTPPAPATKPEPPKDEEKTP